MTDHNASAGAGEPPESHYRAAKMQEIVMRKAYKDAGLDFAGIDYVECHGE
jgi:3-oxoacyl-(acyl-carrier-protein) synthase